MKVSDYGETIIHEFTHNLGATDKYTNNSAEPCETDPVTGKQYDGYDIMCHSISSANGFIQPQLDDLVVSDPTASEIGWLPKIPPPKINVLPQKEAEWVVGKTYTIKWLSENYSTSSNVIIELFTTGAFDLNSGISIKPERVLQISEYTPNDGSYSWTIPETLAPSSYTINVTCANYVRLCSSDFEKIKIIAPPTKTPSCVDNDGNDPYTYGSVTLKNPDGSSRVISDFCKDSTVLNEYACTAAGEFLGDNFACPNGCSNGACVVKTNTPSSIVAPPTKTPSCVDNDGNDPYIYSFITLKNPDGSSRVLNDFCRDSSILNEYACTAGGEFLGDNFACPNGCSNGACVVKTNASSPSCVDNDGGDPYTYGSVTLKNPDGSSRVLNDFCRDSSILNEYACTAAGEFLGDNFACPNGCSNGACVVKTNAPSPSCVDNDGNDPYTYSFITLKNPDGSSRVISDFCKDSTVLNEYACTAAGEFLGDNFACPNGCSNGACIKTGASLGSSSFNLANILSAIERLIKAFSE